MSRPAAGWPKSTAAYTRITMARLSGERSPSRAHDEPPIRYRAVNRAVRSGAELDTRLRSARPIPAETRDATHTHPDHTGAGLSPGCRAVELSRLRRGAVEALSRRCRGLACRACRVTVEFLSSLSSLTPCACGRRVLSRSVEVCRVAVELSSNVELMNSCLAVEPGNACKHSDSHSSA